MVKKSKEWKKKSVNFNLRLTASNAAKIEEIRIDWKLNNRNQTINEVISRIYEIERWRPSVIAFQKFMEKLNDLQV